MEPQENLVIHAGELMHQSKALKLMLEEFLPFGYSQEAIETFVARAFNATQKFLFELSFLAKEHQDASLATALRKDAQIAAHWRSQSREAREAHAAKIEADRVRRQKEYEEKQARQWKHEQALRAAQLKEHQRAEWEARVKHWHERNETGGWKAQAQQRARQRQQEDQRQMRELMRRVEQRAFRTYRRGYRQTGMIALDCLSDHDYIEWMFECHSKPCSRWLGGVT